MKVHALLMVEGRDIIPDEGQEGKIRTVYADRRGRIIIKGFNESNNSIDINDIAAALLSREKELGITQLTAPGETSAKNVELKGVYGYLFTVASIGTNIIVRLEINNDGTNWAVATLKNSVVAGAAIASNQMTITSNGTYIIWSEDPAIETRLDWVSESTGAPTLDADYFCRRK